MQRLSLSILVATGFSSATIVAAQSPGTPPILGRIGAVLQAREANLISFRRDLHRHPELSGQEQRTAKMVADRLTALGLEVRTNVGGHGVVGVVRGGKPGPLVAFRADMDAVASTAPDPVDFASLVPGVRHICGHDVHTTIGLALAEGFSAVRAELAGTVMLIFQPAEESVTGARAMLADGIFARERPIAIYAVHTAPYELGELATAPGGLMAGRDRVEVVITGAGARSAAADSVRRLIERIGTIAPSQLFAPTARDFVLIQNGPVRASEDTARFGVQVSLADSAVRRRVQEQIARLDDLVFAGIRVKTHYNARAVAGVTNDPSLVARANQAVANALGDRSIQLVEDVLPAFSEDFGSFQELVPGVMYFLGVSNSARGTAGMPHSPNYVADEGAILVGARAMAAAITAHFPESHR